jgi:hypothetical protein
VNIIADLLVIIVLGILWPNVGKGCFITLVALFVGLPTLFFVAALIYNAVTGNGQ